MKRNPFERRSGPRKRAATRTPFWRRSVRNGAWTIWPLITDVIARLSGRRSAHTAHAHIEHLKDARWELTEVQARFRELLDSQSDLIIRRDADGRVVFANAAFCKAFDVALDDVRGEAFWPPVLQSPTTHPDRSGRTRKIENLSTAAGPRWIEWEQHRITQADAQSDIQSVGRDVTDALSLEAELRDARDQADAANRAKSRFLAAMSHEIRTPMNGILGMASLLQETGQSKEQEAYTRAIDLSAKSLLALIDEILDFSKIEAGKLQLVIAPFSLRACIASALELMQPNAARRGNALSYVIDDDVPAVLEGDAARVRQIVLNLVSNAVKFTENGDVSIRVRRTASARFELSVKDTGIGFSAETMSMLFREFEQADDLQYGRQSGTGLGLAISRRLARAMNGDISADGAPGKGATFIVTFELVEPTGVEVRANNGNEAPALQTTRSPMRSAGAPRVLLAEDNEINALLARRVCERAGCSVVVVKDGRSAVASVEQAAMQSGQAFDLILMDVFMPHLDGLEATRAIKAVLTECPPIIALTANAFADDRDRCLAAGMDDYLAKPFDVQQLQAVLQRWLPRDDARRAS